jgi:hypothetical protein
MSKYQEQIEVLLRPYVEKYNRKPITMQIDVNEYLEDCANSSWDRPSAFYAVAKALGIKNPRELLMHSPLDPIWFAPDDKTAQAELDYLNKVFDGSVPPRLLSTEWDT